MLRARPQAMQDFAVCRRTVSLVLAKPVTRVQVVKLAHHCVTLNLGDNRGGTDGGNRCIAANNRVAVQPALAKLKIG